MSKKKKYMLRNPLAVHGGIRAQYAGAGYMRVWWGRRWVDMMEKFRLGARLGRGRNYAEAGQVSELIIEEGEVRGVVQGVKKDPYISSIKFRTLQGQAKKQVIKDLRANPVLIARLLVGDLPVEIEHIIRRRGCPLFPGKTNDLVSRCSCPDWANPCKHLAAVYYLLGEEISKNPMLLLKLRGISRSTLFAAAKRVEKPASVEKKRSCRPGVKSFYGEMPLEDPDYGDEKLTGVTAPLIHRLGALPFWRGQDRFIDALEHLYDRALSRGWKVRTDEPLDVRREEEKTVIKGANLNLKHRRMTIDATML
ncbi:MAG: SWIM zinc finger family protein [Kiritimatiellia bacterium]